MITFPEEGLILIFFYYKYYFVSAEGHYVLSDELNKYVVKEENLRVIENSLNYLERAGYIEGLRRVGDSWLCSRLKITDNGIQYFRTEIDIEALKNAEILKVGKFRDMLEKIEKTSIGRDSRLTWDQPTEPMENIMGLFASILKIMEQRLEQNFFEEALQSHNLRITWKNVENELRERDGHYGITNRSPDWYMKETFPRVMNSSYILDKENFLSFIDDILVKVSIVKIVKPYLNELRSRLKSLEFSNQCIEQMSIFRE